MPWEGVTMKEQRQNLIRDHQLNYYSVTELSERFSVSRKTAHKWINRFNEFGRNGFAELSRRPHTCPHQTPPEVREALIEIRQKHGRWGPLTLLDKIAEGHPDWTLPAKSTVCRILKDADLVKPRHRGKRLHPGCPKSRASEPNEIWAADYKGQFRLRNSSYCFPLTVSDLAVRFLLGCDAHPAVSLQRTMRYFRRLFQEYGLPQRIRTDNGVPFASNALARLSRLSVWFITLGIYPELIEPGHPEQNGIHERMHRTLKAEACIPPEYSLTRQQARFDAFRHEFNHERPHQALGMKRPAQLYRPSPREFPSKVPTYDYPNHYLVRRVSRQGAIRVFCNQIFVATPLMEHYVGLEEIDDGVYDLYFCFYHIGRYHHRENRLDGVISKVNAGRRLADRPERV
jgi:transposase InsO family protein